MYMANSRRARAPVASVTAASLSCRLPVTVPQPPGASCLQGVNLSRQVAIVIESPHRDRPRARPGDLPSIMIMIDSAQIASGLARPAAGRARAPGRRWGPRHGLWAFKLFECMTQSQPPGAGCLITGPGHPAVTVTSCLQPPRRPLGRAPLRFKFGDETTGAAARRL
jgi:hypothetical protein